MIRRSDQETGLCRRIFIAIFTTLFYAYFTEYKVFFLILS
ncbi:hypothetical protein EC970246_B0009 [Escherichia coli 97.0246]|uniref:Uncharacterized protein n=1 Tax=Escherichia coli 97.0246 TaxID=869670 RepID=A0A8E0KWX9_ECOLX|nr:hypothetical protein EC970246_B0009 [Escherichia coli 97.0246]